MQKQESTAQANLKQLRRKLAAAGLCLASASAMLFMVTGARYVTPAMRGNAELSPAYFNTVLLGDLSAEDTGVAQKGTGTSVTNENGTVIQTVSAQKLKSSLHLNVNTNAFGTSSKVYTVDATGKEKERDDLTGAAPGDEFRMTFTIANGTTVHDANGDVDPANGQGRNTVANQAETDIRYTLSIITTNNLPLTYSLKDVDTNTIYNLTGTNMIYDALGGMCTVYTVKNSADQIFDSEGARILPWLGEDTISFHRYQLIAKWKQDDNRYNAYAYDTKGRLIENWVDAAQAVSENGISTEDYLEGDKHYRYVRDAEGKYTLRKQGTETKIYLTNEGLKSEYNKYQTEYEILTYQLQNVPGNSALYMKEIENIEVRVEVESFVNPTKPDASTETYVSTGQIVLGVDGKGTLSMEQFVNSSGLADEANILAARTVSYGAFGQALEPLNTARANPTAEETLRQTATTENQKLYRYNFRLANGVQESVTWQPGADTGTQPADPEGEPQEGEAQSAAEPTVPVLEDKTGQYQKVYTFDAATKGGYDRLNLALAVPLGDSGVGGNCLTGRKYYIVTRNGTRYDAVTNETASSPNPDSLTKILVTYFKRKKQEDGSYNYSGNKDSGWAVLNFVKADDPDNTPLTTEAFVENKYSVQSFTLYMQCDADDYEPHVRTSTDKAEDSRDEFKLYFYKTAAAEPGPAPKPSTD